MPCSVSLSAFAPARSPSTRAAVAVTAAGQPSSACCLSCLSWNLIPAPKLSAAITHVGTILCMLRVSVDRNVDRAKARVLDHRHDATLTARSQDARNSIWPILLLGLLLGSPAAPAPTLASCSTRF